MTVREERVYEFGPLRIGAEERLVHRDGLLVPRPPKAAETLIALVSSPGRMLEKGDLMKIVWPDTFVEEGALARNISQLRKALGEGPDDSQYIETIPKRGYRFVAQVRETSGEPAPPPVPHRRTPWAMWIGIATMVILAGVVAWVLLPKSPRGLSGIPVHILAVLPFDNLSKDPAQDYFSEGMTQLLITNLTRIATLKVISLASVTSSSVDHKPSAAQAREC